jgi:hypothetical protein
MIMDILHTGKILGSHSSEYEDDCLQVAISEVFAASIIQVSGTW